MAVPAGTPAAEGTSAAEGIPAAETAVAGSLAADTAAGSPVEDSLAGDSLRTHRAKSGTVERCQQPPNGGQLCVTRYSSCSSPCGG